VICPQLDPRFALAACRGQDPELFFPSKGDDVRPARAICSGCLVLDPCREWALAHELMGIWGGLTACERRKERAARGLRCTEPEHIDRANLSPLPTVAM
jgi:hypothetical protein